MDKSELFKKIDAMNEQELWSYHNSAKVATTVMDIIGVLLIFSMLVFSNPIMLGLGAFIVYIVAQIAASMGKTIDYIEERIVDIVDK